MNILYFNKDTDLDVLYDIKMMLRDNGSDLLILPDTTHLMVDVPVEHLFDAMDRICLAIETIRKERPEEYTEAKNHCWYELLRTKLKERDKEWTKEVERIGGRVRKQKNLCDTCTVPRPCPDDNGEPKEKCIWYSRNPGGI